MWRTRPGGQARVGFVPGDLHAEGADALVAGDRHHAGGLADDDGGRGAVRPDPRSAPARPGSRSPRHRSAPDAPGASAARAKSGAAARARARKSVTTTSK